VVYESVIMSTMGGQKQRPINRLQALLPEGRLTTTAWLGSHGYSRQLVAKYVKAGWLQAVAHGVYRRPGPPFKWQHVVASLSALLDDPPHVGGLSALELRGYAHFLKPRGAQEIHLYAKSALPAWVSAVPLREKLVLHRDRLFETAAAKRGEAGLVGRGESGCPESTDAFRQTLTAEPWGEWDWEILYSTPERAILELLEQVPQRESVIHADAVIAGLADLSSTRMVVLLAACRSIKVKRLFLALAGRHRHGWIPRVQEAVNRGEFDLGRGKRVLVPGGRLHPRYLITLPPELSV